MGSARLRSLAIRAFARVATSAFMGWLSDWHIRAQLAVAAEQTTGDSLTFDDVVPWQPKGATALPRYQSSFIEYEGFPRITESGLPDQFGRESHVSTRRSP